MKVSVLEMKERGLGKNSKTLIDKPAAVILFLALFWTNNAKAEQ